MGEDSPNRIRILLLEESGLFRSSLARVLAAEPDFEITGECGSAEEALKNLAVSRADVALLDSDARPQPGNCFLTAAREAGYTGQFVIVTGSAEAASAASALKLGAAGIFLKSEAPERLAHAIRMVAAGEIWIEPKVIQILAEQLLEQIPPDGPPSGLEERERSVLLGILSGLTNRKIGERLGLSENSVKNTVQRLFGKTGVRKRSQLVRVALETGSTRTLARNSLLIGPP